MVYINYLSTHCTFIYLILKIVKLLPTNYKPGQREHFRKLKISESEHISKGLHLWLAEYKCLETEKKTYFFTTKTLRK